jgi:hypothetical protein
MRRRTSGLLVTVALLLAAGAAQAAGIRMFSYDASDAPTRRVAGGLTFEFRQAFMTTRVLRIDATGGDASAPLREAQDHDLGTSLSALIGEMAAERDLYEVLPQDQGADMIHAFCPGSARAWLAMGRMRSNLPLRVHVLGSSASGPAHVCATLNFDFHGEWRGLRPREAVRQNEIRTPHFPY